MNNAKRNHPCPCGSGRKYKKCCLPKENEIMEEGKTIATPHSLKNEKNIIELETEKVGVAEMLRRDQFVTMRQLQVHKAMLARDEEYNLAAIAYNNAFLKELSELPLSEGVSAVEAMVQKHIDVLARQVEQSRFARVNDVTLKALEAIFNGTSEPTCIVEPPAVVAGVLYDDTEEDEPEELKDE